jgi:hypothetical protein
MRTKVFCIAAVLMAGTVYPVFAQIWLDVGYRFAKMYGSLDYTTPYGTTELETDYIHELGINVGLSLEFPFFEPEVYGFAAMGPVMAGSDDPTHMGEVSLINPGNPERRSGEYGRIPGGSIALGVGLQVKVPIKWRGGHISPLAGFEYTGGMSDPEFSWVFLGGLEIGGHGGYIRGNYHYLLSNRSQNGQFNNTGIPYEITNVKMHGFSIILGFYNDSPMTTVYEFISGPRAGERFTVGGTGGMRDD